MKPTATGTYTVRVTAKDSTGALARKEFTLTVNPAVAELQNTSKLSTTSITLGESVTVSCSSTGGNGTKQYAVWYKNATQTSWTQARDYATGTSVTITPNHAGTYTVSVKVKDAAGTVKTKRMDVAVASNLTNTSTVAESTVVVNGTITVKCSATGGRGSKEYAVYYKRSAADSWSLKQDYAVESTVKITPKFADTYSIRVKVKDGDGIIKTKTLTVTTVAALKNTSKLAATSITYGNSVKVTCSSTGGIGTKQYAVWYKLQDSSTWNKGRDYAAETTVTVTPKHTGTYTVRVKAKDSKGTVVNKDLSLQVKSVSLANTSVISANTIEKGSSIRITCSSTGGTGTKQYAIYYKRDSVSSWSTKQDYSTNTSATLTLKFAESYLISVKVKDNAGTVVRKQFTVTVTDPNALKCTSKINATSTTAGSSLSVTLSAVNGTSPYTYTVSRMKIGTSTWTTIKSGVKTGPVSVSFTDTGTYQVRVTVKDAAGGTASQYFTVTVK